MIMGYVSIKMKRRRHKQAYAKLLPSSLFNISRLKSELGLDGSCLSLVARLAEERKHITLVRFNTRLVERIHTKHVSGDS